MTHTSTQQPEALRFIKKPVVIEAFQMTEERRVSNTDEAIAWIENHPARKESNHDNQ